MVAGCFLYIVYPGRAVSKILWAPGEGFLSFWLSVAPVAGRFFFIYRMPGELGSATGTRAQRGFNQPGGAFFAKVQRQVDYSGFETLGGFGGSVGDAFEPAVIYFLWCLDLSFIIPHAGRARFGDGHARQRKINQPGGRIFQDFR